MLFQFFVWDTSVHVVRGRMVYTLEDIDFRMRLYLADSLDVSERLSFYARHPYKIFVLPRLIFKMHVFFLCYCFDFADNFLILRVNKWNASQEINNNKLDRWRRNITISENIRERFEREQTELEVNKEVDEIEKKAKKKNNEKRKRAKMKIKRKQNTYIDNEEDLQNLWHYKTTCLPIFG